MRVSATCKPKSSFKLTKKHSSTLKQASMLHRRARFATTAFAIVSADTSYMRSTSFIGAFRAFLESVTRSGSTLVLGSSSVPSTNWSSAKRPVSTPSLMAKVLMGAET